MVEKNIILIGEFLLMEESNMKENNSDIGYDVKDDAWKVYRKMYGENLNFESIDRDKRPHIESKFKHGNKSSKKMKFSGEIDFNFSNNKIWELARSRYQHYKKILEKDSVGEEFIKMLDECCKKHHSPENISLMLQTGNMQGAKKGIGLDRLGVWLLVLKMKYENNINLLQNHGTVENSSEIEAFLDLFEDVYDYAKTIYHVDRKLVDDLIESGKKPLDSACNIINYMRLAKRFWEQKRKYLESKD